jgi:hypothetical protein
MLKEEGVMSVVLSRRSLSTAAMLGLAAHIALLSMPIGAANAQGVKPIQNPITGDEDLGDLSQPQGIGPILPRVQYSRSEHDRRKFRSFR